MVDHVDVARLQGEVYIFGKTVEFKATACLDNIFLNSGVFSIFVTQAVAGCTQPLYTWDKDCRCVVSSFYHILNVKVGIKSVYCRCSASFFDFLTHLIMSHMTL